MKIPKKTTTKKGGKRKIKISRKRKFSASSASSNSTPNSPQKTTSSINVLPSKTVTANGLKSSNSFSTNPMNGVNGHIPNGVHSVNAVNPRKRGYDAISQSHPSSHPPPIPVIPAVPGIPGISAIGAVAVGPPTKRRKSSRRNAQKLVIPKIPISSAPTSNGNVQIVPSVPSTLPVPPKMAHKVKGKKRIKLKVKRGTQSNSRKKPISETPSVALMESVTFKHLQSKYPQYLVVAATKMFGDETYRAEMYCQQRIKEESIPNLPALPRIQPHAQQQSVVVRPRPASQLRKLWGRYEVDIPRDPDGMEYIKMKQFLDDFMSNISDSVHNQQIRDRHADGFVSGLGIKHQWVEPQEIGEITVGPYVVDIAIETDC